jgi:YidC/Oxa1 family membrane protein insertase
MFEFIVNIFNTFLYFPLFNLLVLLYDYVPGHDFGISIIFLTIIIRLVLYPLSVKAVRSQRALSALQPKLSEIQKLYKDDREKQAKETMDLYKKENINPFSGLFLTLIQLPILIALYRVFWDGLKPETLAHLYSFVINPGHINTLFLGFLNLSAPNIVLAIIAGVIQFYQTKMIMPSSSKTPGKSMDMAAMMQKQMVYFLPLLTVVILLRLPSALGLYWIATGIFSIVQQYLIIKNHPIKTN